MSHPLEGKAVLIRRLVRLIVKRKRQALLPWFTGPLLVLDEMLGRRIGNRILRRKFPRG